MVAEIMGLLIFIGVALLFFARYQGGKGKKRVNSKELASSIESLHREIDKASTEAIERMGSYVSRFERLIRDAKTSDENLSYRIKEIRTLEDRFRKDMMETRAVLDEIKRERERTIDLRDELARQAALASQIMNAGAERPMINVTKKRAVESYEQANIVSEPTRDMPLLSDVGDKSSNNFADILSESIERQNESEREALEPARETYEPTPEAVELAKAEPAQENPSVVAKRMLAAGASVEDVTRKTGMGRGAVELLAQMLKR